MFVCSISFKCFLCEREKACGGNRVRRKQGKKRCIAYASQNCDFCFSSGGFVVMHTRRLSFLLLLICFMAFGVVMLVVMVFGACAISGATNKSIEMNELQINWLEKCAHAESLRLWLIILPLLPLKRFCPQRISMGMYMSDYITEARRWADDFSCTNPRRGA